VSFYSITENGVNNSLKYTNDIKRKDEFSRAIGTHCIQVQEEGNSMNAGLTSG
jgi:hypothetical protein